MPAGTTVRHYSPHEATVDGWCSGLFGLTGKGITEFPVKVSWFTITITMTLRWTDDGWRLAESTQKDGPDPGSAAAYGQAPRCSRWLEEMCAKRTSPPTTQAPRWRFA